MSHTLLSAAVLLASLAAASALFRPPFLPMFGPGPIVPFFGPRPLLPIRPIVPFVPPVMPPMVRFNNRQRRTRVSQQVNQVGSVGSSRPRTRPFVATNTGGNRSDRPIDGVTVNLIDGRQAAPSNVYLVDYGRDGLFDNSMDGLALAGPGLNFDVGLGGIGPGVSGMDIGAGFLGGGDRFGSGDVSIDGNVYISNAPKPGPGVGMGVGGSLSPAMGSPVASAIGPVGADVFDYGLSSMPLDAGNLALGGAPQGAPVPLI